VTPARCVIPCISAARPHRHETVTSLHGVLLALTMTDTGAGLARATSLPTRPDEASWVDRSVEALHWLGAGQLGITASLLVAAAWLIAVTAAVAALVLSARPTRSADDRSRSLGSAILLVACALVVISGLASSDALIVLIGTVGMAVVLDMAVVRAGLIDQLQRRLTRIGPVSFAEEREREVWERTARLQQETFGLRLNAASFASKILTNITERKLSLAQYLCATELARHGLASLIATPGTSRPSLEEVATHLDDQDQGTSPGPVPGDVRPCYSSLRLVCDQVDAYLAATELARQLRPILEAAVTARGPSSTRRLLEASDLLEGAGDQLTRIPEWYTLTALLRIRLEDEERGLATLYHGAGSFPEDPHLLTYLATVMGEGTKNYEGAAPLWVRAVAATQALSAHVAGGRSELATALAGSPDLAAAWDAVAQQLLKWLDGITITMRNNAAYVLALAGRNEEEPRALRWATLAVESEQSLPEDERNPTYLDTLGVVHLRYGLIDKDILRIEDAQRLFERALRIADLQGRSRVIRASLQHLEDTRRTLGRRSQLARRE